MNVLLSAAAIAACRRAEAPEIAIEVVAQTASTNADLLARVGQLAQPTMLAAMSQTAGRGRAGRAWRSSPDDSLTFSLAWPFHVPVRALAGLPLAVGVALAGALADGGAPVRLKWPNDLLLDGAKVGGILIETALDRNRGDCVWAVIGVGINLALPAALAAQIGQPAAALPQTPARDRNRLLAQILDSLAEALPQFARRGLAPFAPRWNALHAWHGQAVQIIEHERVLLQGIAAGVDAQGQLLLDTASGRVPVLAGDVSLRQINEEGAHRAS